MQSIMLKERKQESNSKAYTITKRKKIKIDGN